MGGVRRLVGLSIVGIVVSLGVDRVVSSVGVGIALVGFIVSVGVMDVVDGILSSQEWLALLPRFLLLHAHHSLSVGRRDDHSRA